MNYKDKKGIDSMDREAINEYFLNLIKEIIDKYPHFSTGLLVDSAEVFDNCTFNERLEIHQEQDIEITFGASKIVFISERDDEYSKEYIVKIPINFDNTNYCLIEQNYYKEIKKEIPNFLKYFAECWYGGSVNIIDEDGFNVEVPFYIMARADINEEVVSTTSYNYWINNGGRPDTYDGEEEAFNCLKEFYGEENIEELMEFLEEMDIGDIHNGNIGFVKGNPILIDYSGYWS